MRGNNHRVSDVADPGGWEDTIIWLAAAFGKIIPGDAFNFFYFEVNWVEYRYLFEMDCETCTIKRAEGSWPIDKYGG